MDFNLPDELKELQTRVRKFAREELQPLESKIGEDDNIPKELRDWIRICINRTWCRK
jgi:alkylation response protein AidB-like acyl-CoA dehydrogenase